MRDRLELALGERLGAPDGRVIVTAGASEAIACACGGLLSPGDEALVESPGYEPHRAVPRLFGATVRMFPRERERGWAGFAAAVEASVGPRTRVVMITHLHNPTGATLEPRDVEALDAIAERKNLWIVCDETYRDAATGPLGTQATRGPRWVSISSLTKSYGLGGLRLGWIAAFDAARARCANAQNGLSANPAMPSMSLALALVPHLDALRTRTHTILARHHERWEAFASRREDGNGFDRGTPPQGTTVFARFAGEAQGDAFAEFASREFDLAVTPGRFFGDPAGVRISLGREPERFAAALEVLERAVPEFIARGATEVRA